MTFLIYGANGYTGELIAREAKLRGLTPVLGGRNADKLRALGDELGLPSRTFALDDVNEVRKALEGIRVVLHCAGPFSATSASMIEGCLEAKTHYLDITGEIDVFEHAHAQHARAEQAGIVVCPGVGFDVIPTDCVALTLKRALPDASSLALGFDSQSPMSAGTAKSSLEGLLLGGRIRKDGKLVRVPLAHRVRRIDFGAGERTATTIPWGDISTAYHSTGIPNIEFFVAAPRSRIAGVRFLNQIRFLLAAKPVQGFLKRRAARTRGPSAEEREQLSTYVWGEATNPGGATKTARIRTANGYSLTVTGSLAVVADLLRREANGASLPAGTTTPARLMGADFVTKLPGSGSLVVE